MQHDVEIVRMKSFGARARRWLGAPPVAAALLFVLAAPTLSAQAAQPEAVTAVYDVSFGGLQVGKFRFESTYSGSSYRASGTTEIKALLGALEFSADMTGQGRMREGEATPERYSQTFDSKRKLFFKTKKKSKTADLSFRNGRVSSMKVSPPAKTDDREPLNDSHLTDVLDPVSAVIAMSQVQRGSDPCRRTLKVFDGRQRFDLALSYKSSRKISGTSGRAQDDLIVCGVRYQPVAGHKLNDDGNEKLARNGGIEIHFRRIAGADVMVASKIIVPTGMGTASIVATHVEMTLGGRKQVAFAK